MLADRTAPSGASLNDKRSHTLVGDLNSLLDANLADNAAAIASTRAQAEVVLHLAATVNDWCEADFDPGIRSNADAIRALLQMCRSVKIQPMVVFSSSLAVFGYSAAQPLPAVINGRTCPRRQTATASKNSSVKNWWPITVAKVSFALSMCV